MRTFTRLVFDDHVPGTTAVFTSDAFSDLLGAADQLAIQVVATNISGTSPSLILRVQTSHDGRLWSYKSATPEIDSRGITPGGTTTEVGTDSGATPSLARVRLQIALGGTNPAAYLRVWVSGRASRKSMTFAASPRPTVAAAHPHVEAGDGLSAPEPGRPQRASASASVRRIATATRVF